MKRLKSVVAGTLALSIAVSFVGCDSSSSKKKKRHRRNRDRDSRIEETVEPVETETIRETRETIETAVETRPVLETTESTAFNNGNRTTPDGKTIINVWSFTDELGSYIDYYVETHPDFAAQYEVEYIIHASTGGEYEAELDNALVNGGEYAPDIYCLDSAFVSKYTQGTMSYFAATYNDLGINADSEVVIAEIAPYIVQVGTRPSDDEVVALSYQSAGGAFIYRRSIAVEVFGTDDPEIIGDIIGSGSGSWDDFFQAAEVLHDNGYAIVSGDGDIWHAIDNSAQLPWVVDNSLVIDPNREAFLDYSLMLSEGGYSNGTVDWTEDWYDDMTGIGPTPCFAYMGPCWFIEYVLNLNCDLTYGDWAICPPPVGFFWGGSWLACNVNSSPEAMEGAAELLYWMTLDTSETGLQYLLANGLTSDGTFNFSVASSVVMNNSDGTDYVLGGQNMYDVFVVSNELANGNNLSAYDESVSYLWRDVVTMYVNGDISRDEAMIELEQRCQDYLGIN